MPGDPSQDQDFMNAHPGEQHAYLMDTDPDYAKATPQDQTAYLNHIWSTHPPQAPTLPVNPVRSAAEPVSADKLPPVMDAPLPFGPSSAAAPWQMIKGVGRGALGGYAGTEVADKLHLGPIGKTILGVAGAGVGLKTPELAESAANRLVGEENVPMWMKSAQSVGKMIHGAKDEMYNDLGNRAMTPATPPPTEPPVTPQGPTRVNPPPKAVDPVREAVRQGTAAKIPVRMEPAPYTPQGPTRINETPGNLIPEEPGPVQGPTRVNDTPGGLIPEEPGPVQGPTRINRGSSRAVGKVISEKPNLVLTPEEVRAQEQLAKAKEAQTQDLRPEARRRGMSYAAGRKPQ